MKIIISRKLAVAAVAQFKEVEKHLDPRFKTWLAGQAKKDVRPRVDYKKLFSIDTGVPDHLMLVVDDAKLIELTELWTETSAEAFANYVNSIVEGSRLIMKAIGKLNAVEKVYERLANKILNR